MNYFAPNMIFIQLILLVHLQISHGNWLSDWMEPMKQQFSEDNARKLNDDTGMTFDDEELKLLQGNPSTDSLTDLSTMNFATKEGQLFATALKEQLESTLKNARSLAETLKRQITALADREKLLKEIIYNGRFGVTAVEVTTTARAPRSYIIRDGVWHRCEGSIQYPTKSGSAMEHIFTVPRCIGQEVVAKNDPCTFNSVIQYEAIPLRRKVEYDEDEYICLQNSFNTTLEKYSSVPRSTINGTCTSGVVRTVTENIEQCGIRMTSEFSYYPLKRPTVTFLPLEYCTEKDGSCKLIVAWHIANSTVENFNFLKKDSDFKKFFMKSGPYIEHAF